MAVEMLRREPLNKSKFGIRLKFAFPVIFWQITPIERVLLNLGMSQ